MEALWKQALKTFAGRKSVGYKLCQRSFDKLWNLMNKITAEDVKLDKKVLDFVKLQTAPLCVIDIFENEDLTIAIFILKHGVTMPMHDHPGMHGLLKVISGTVEVRSYSLKTNDDHVVKPNEEMPAIRHPPITVHSNSPTCILTPYDKNLHEISCINGPAAFLDILSPPYDTDEYGKGPRPCTFFHVVDSKFHSESKDGDETVRLMVLTEHPPEFYSRNIEYAGPPLT